MRKQILLLVAAQCLLKAAPPPAAVAAFDAYIGEVESRLAVRHLSSHGFLAPGQNIERLAPSPPADFPGAMLHHWRGTAFAHGATTAKFEALLRDFNSYPQVFSPEVLQARVLKEDGDRVQASMRIQQKHILTVVMDATYDVTFGRLDAQHRYSLSRSTRMLEVADEDHGFLWCLNTYWSYEERDNGLYLQIEAVSLSRGIPAGLGWMLRPFVESVPRESLGFTLQSVCNALQKQKGHQS